MLGDRYELEYRLDHLCLVTLVCFFHSMSLSCFLPRAFVFLSWLDTSFHFAVTYWMLRDMFIDHDHLVFALYTYHGLSTSFLCWILDSIFNLMLEFSLRNGERRIFTSTLFSRDSPWSPYYSSLMELELKVDSRICGYRWSIDLVIACFSHLSLSRIIDGDSLVTFVAISQWIPLWL